MRSRLIALMSGLSLALGAAAVLGAGAAQADGSPDLGGPVGTSSTSVVAVFGTIVSVDSATGTFTADAYLPSTDQGNEGPGDDHGAGDDRGQSEPPGQSGTPVRGTAPGQGGRGPSGRLGNDWMAPSSATQVTIMTNSSTTVQIDGQPMPASNLSQGNRFVALLSGSPGESLQTLVANPALAVYAHTPPAGRQLYAFVGTVTAVNPGTGGTGTVTVQVTNSVPSGLVQAGSNPAEFTVSAGTLVLGGTAVNGLFGGSLSGVHVTDVVAGGFVGSSGETLSQVESTPLQALIDFPAPTSGSPTASISRARATALHQALAVFGYHGHVKRARHRGHHRHVRHRGHRRHGHGHRATRHHPARRHGARK